MTRRLLAAVIVVSLLLVSIRSTVELKNRGYILAVPLSELNYLLAKENIDPEQALGKLKKAGALALIISELRTWQLKAAGLLDAVPSEKKNVWNLKLTESLSESESGKSNNNTKKNLQNGFELRNIVCDEGISNYDSSAGFKVEILDDRPKVMPDWPLGFQNEFYVNNQKISRKQIKDKGFILVAEIDAPSKLKTEILAKYLEEVQIWADYWYMQGIDPVEGQLGLIEKVIKMMGGFKSKAVVQPLRVEFSGQKNYENLIKKNVVFSPFIHSISRREMSRYAGDVPEKYARFRRAVQERGVKLLLVRPQQSENFETYLRDIKHTVKINSELPWPVNPMNSKDEIQNEFSYKSDFSSLKLVEYLRYLLAVLATLALINFFIDIGKRFLSESGFIRDLIKQRKFFEVINLTIVFISLIMLFNNSEIYLLIVALMVASTIPVAGLIYLFEETRTYKSKNLTTECMLFARIVFIWLIGGVVISALMTSPEYLGRLYAFRGVKVALLFPPASIFLIVFLKTRHVIRGKLNSMTGYSRRIAVGTVLSLVAIVLTMYIIRSGNYFNELIPDWELSFRSWLERTMLVRPRTKEWLIGYPALYLLVTRDKWRQNILSLMLFPAAAVGGASLINTFCHAHTPFLIGIWRTVNGILTGIIMAIVVSFALRMINEVYVKLSVRMRQE